MGPFMRGQTAGMLLICTSAVSAPPDAAQHGTDAGYADGFGELFKGFGDFDWDAEADRAKQAVEQLWKRNGWTDESDLFARDLGCEVSKIPPWEVTARLSLLTTRVAGRYGLSEEQAKRLQGSILRETAGFLFKHSRTLIEFTHEAVGARAAGKPYTVEQVRRWSKTIEPLMADTRASVERVSKQIEPSLSPEKKAVLQRDLASFEKRADYIDKMATSWAEGNWKPEDWGLEKDPIQSGTLTAPTPASIAPPVIPTEPIIAPIPTRWVPHDPGTWIAYVIDVQKRYGFDAGQKSSAQSIYAELVSRASDYIAAHRTELAIIPLAERAEHPRYEPVCTLFGELQERLDALPTTAQRNSARE